jgi:subtilase family serine protease
VQRDPLHAAGLDGAGETVVFLEIDQFKQSDLNLYASQYHLSPFNVTVDSSPSYGSPAGTEGEADLDLEIVHATAPDAKLVVYYAGPGDAGEVQAYAAMVAAYPQAIVSDSIGGCELGGSAFSDATEPIFRKLAATGGTLFNAAGDSGAFTCSRNTTVANWNAAKQKPNVSNPADDPYVTAVGGTSIFPAGNGDYGREAVWGNAVEQSGGGGGLSLYFKRPSWQTGPGVTNSFSNGMRQIPDVSSLGDENTGWNIAVNGSFQLIGGTSTGAPLWAGLAALADQSLTAHGHQTMGFVDPALYYFGSHAKSIPAVAFHDVTVGDNLYYPATPGWDFATGLGTPNAAGLVDDLLAYEPKR